MGLIDKNMTKGHERQKASLLKELAAANISVKSVEEIEVESNKTTSAIGSSLKALTGGKLTPDFFQVFILDNQNRDHLYIQPYSGMVVLPGEHHIMVKGTLSSAVALTDEAIFGGPSWRSAKRDKEIETRLNKSNPQLKYLNKKCKFEWAIGMSKIELKWAVQVYAIGDGISHIVMQTGRYGGFTTYEVGFGYFSAVVEQISSLLDSNVGPVQAPLHAIPYIGIAKQMLLGDVEPDFPTDEREEVAQPVEKADYEELLKSSVTPFVAKKVMVGSIPDKKEKNIRKHVLPADVQNDEIVAAFDITLFGSAKDAVVFTKTHCYVKEIDDRYTIPYADLVAVNGLKGTLGDKLELQLSNETIKIPIGNHEESLPVVFNAIANNR